MLVLFYVYIYIYIYISANVIKKQREKHIKSEKLSKPNNVNLDLGNSNLISSYYPTLLGL